MDIEEWAMRDFSKEPREILEAKLALADMTIELGEVTREKWARLETMRDVLKKEEDLIKQIAEATKALGK
jgi:hypothetical protein